MQGVGWFPIFLEPANIFRLQPKFVLAMSSPSPQYVCGWEIEVKNHILYTFKKYFALKWVSGLRRHLLSIGINF